MINYSAWFGNNPFHATLFRELPAAMRIFSLQEEARLTFHPALRAISVHLPTHTPFFIPLLREEHTAWSFWPLRHRGYFGTHLSPMANPCALGFCWVDQHDLSTDRVFASTEAIEGFFFRHENRQAEQVPFSIELLQDALSIDEDMYARTRQIDRDIVLPVATAIFHEWQTISFLPDATAQSVFITYLAYLNAFCENPQYAQWLTEAGRNPFPAFLGS